MKENNLFLTFLKAHNVFDCFKKNYSIERGGCNVELFIKHYHNNPSAIDRFAAWNNTTNGFDFWKQIHLLWKKTLGKYEEKN